MLDAIARFIGTLVELLAECHWHIASEKRIHVLHQPQPTNAPSRRPASQSARSLLRHFSLAGCQWRPALERRCRSDRRVGDFVDGRQLRVAIFRGWTLAFGKFIPRFSS